MFAVISEVFSCTIDELHNLSNRNKSLAGIGAIDCA